MFVEDGGGFEGRTAMTGVVRVLVQAMLFGSLFVVILKSMAKAVLDEKDDAVVTWVCVLCIMWLSTALTLVTGPVLFNLLWGLRGTP